MKFQFTILDWFIFAVIVATVAGLYITTTPQWEHRVRQELMERSGGLGTIRSF